MVLVKKDLVKKVAKGIKEDCKSDVGKAALLAAGGYIRWVKASGGGLGKLKEHHQKTGFRFSNLPGASLFTGGWRNKSS